MCAEISFGKAPFTIKPKEKFIVVKLFGDLDGNVLKDFEKKSADLSGQKKHILFDLDECVGLHPAWGRLFLLLASEVKKNSKGIRFVATSVDLHHWFSDQGLGQSLKFSPTEEAAEKEFEAVAAVGKKIDVKFVNAFLDAAIKVMKVQSQTDVVPGAPFLKNAKEAFTGDISGVIGLVSEAFNGAIVINFPEATFLGVISRMLGEKFETLTPEISDGAAELTNIISGQAKVTLNELGYGIKMATPSVIVGKNHQISDYTSGPRMSVPFTCDLGSFTIEICQT